MSFVLALAAIVVFGLGGLSFVPHQEARFLAPLLVPLILIFTWNRTKLSRSFWVCFIRWHDLDNIITHSSMVRLFGCFSTLSRVSSLAICIK